MVVKNTWIWGLTETNVVDFLKSSKMRYLRISLCWKFGIGVASYSDKAINLLVLFKKDSITTVYEIRNLADGAMLRQIPDPAIEELLCFHKICNMMKYNPEIAWRGSRLLPSGIDPDNIYD
jgi:hypothetical protein